MKIPCLKIKAFFSKQPYKHQAFAEIEYSHLSYDVASESEITSCNKIDKPLVVYRFMGNDITSITTLRT